MSKLSVTKKIPHKVPNGIYEPYGVKKVIGKTSMKSLAAKAAATVPYTASGTPGKKDELETEEASRCEIIDDDVIEVTPSKTKRSARKKKKDDSICIEEMEDFIVSPVKPRKKRLTKEQKAVKAAEDAQRREAERVRTELLNVLAETCGNDEPEDDVVCTDPPSRLTKPSAKESSVKEHFIVVWKTEKMKFWLGPSETMQQVFEVVSQTMETSPDKVLIFCNSDPSHTVNPLDRLSDIGSERVFLAALKDPSTSSKEPIPIAHKITLNVQSTGSKVRIQIDVDKRAPLENFMSDYCRRMGKKISDFRFLFDGDVLNPKSSSEQLDLEGDEVIDAVPV